jgi:hypothetical protein
MTTKVVAAIVAAGALSGLLAGCGDKKSVDEAETNYCSAADELQAAFKRVADIDPDVTTAEDLRDARDEFADAVGHYEDASTDVAQARSDAGDNPITAFNERIQNIPDDASLTEIGAEMARAGGDFIGDVKTYLDDLDCNEIEQ